MAAEEGAASSHHLLVRWRGEVIGDSGPLRTQSGAMTASFTGCEDKRVGMGCAVNTLKRKRTF